MSTIHRIMVHFHNWFDLFVNIIQFEKTSNRFVDYDDNYVQLVQIQQNFVHNNNWENYTSFQ